MRNVRTVVSSRIEPTSWRMTPARPSIRTVPSEGRSSPASTRITVDLPTPFAPTERDPLAVADAERDVVEQPMSAARALPRQALHLDGAHGADATRSVAGAR